MTKNELTNWLKANPSVDREFRYDENGNSHDETYHKIGEEYFAISWCNNHPCEKWGDKGYIRGFYEPRKVKKVVEFVEITSYIGEDE
jgi:hypothetical protein